MTRTFRNGPLQGASRDVPDGFGYTYRRDRPTYSEVFRYEIDANGRTMSLASFDLERRDNAALFDHAPG